MKIAKLILALALLGTAASVASPALADPAIATASVNVRTGPGAGYRAIDTLSQGERVDTQRCVSGWCLISYEGPGGWVSRGYLAEVTERPKKRRFTNDPVYDPFGGPFDEEFCDRMRPGRPSGCDRFYGRPYRSALPPSYPTPYPPPHWPGQGPGYDPWQGAITGPYRFKHP